MTTEEVGAYMLLLCKSWRENPVASLPADDSVLARWARLTPDRWSACKPIVLGAFRFGTDSRWHQKRLRQEYDKLMTVRRAKKKAAKARWNKDIDAHALHMQSIPIPSPRTTKNVELKDIPQNGFLLFWDTYPVGRKVAKQDALKAWVKRLCEAHTGEIIASLADWKKTQQWQDAEFIPYPATFLNRGQWKDAAPKENGNGGNGISKKHSPARNAVDSSRAPEPDTRGIVLEV